MTRISSIQGRSSTIQISQTEEMDQRSQDSTVRNERNESTLTQLQASPEERQSRIGETAIQGQARRTQLEGGTETGGVQNRFSDWFSQRSRQISNIGRQLTNTANRITNSISPEINGALRLAGETATNSARSLRTHSNTSNYLHSHRSFREIGETLVRTGEQAVDFAQRGINEITQRNSNPTQPNAPGANVIQRDVQPHLQREVRLGHGIIEQGRELAEGLQRRLQEQTTPLRGPVQRVADIANDAAREASDTVRRTAEGTARVVEHAAERQVQILQNTARGAGEVLNQAETQVRQIGSDALNRSIQNAQHAVNDTVQTVQNTGMRGMDIAQDSMNRAMNTARDVVSGNQTTEDGIQQLRQISRDATQQGIAAVEDASHRMTGIANDASRRQTQIGMDAGNQLLQTAQSTGEQLSEVAANGMRQTAISAGQAAVEQSQVARNAVVDSLQNARNSAERLVDLGREIADSAVPRLNVDQQIRELQDGDSMRLSLSGSAGVILGGQIQGEVSISREDQIDPKGNRTPQYNIEYSGELGVNATAELGERLSLGENNRTGLDAQINAQGLGGGRFTFSFQNPADATRAAEILQTPDVLRTNEQNRFLMDHARTLEFNMGTQGTGSGTVGITNGPLQIDGITLQGGAGAREGVRIELPRPNTQDPIRVSRFIEGFGSADASAQLSLRSQGSNNNQRDGGGTQLSSGQLQNRIRVERTVQFPQGTPLSELMTAANDHPILGSTRGQISVSATAEARGGLIAGPGRRETNRITLEGPAENMQEAALHLIRGQFDDAIHTAGPGVTVQMRRERFQTRGFTFAPSISVNGVNASVNVTAERSSRLSRTDIPPVQVERLATEGWPEAFLPEPKM